MKSFIFTKCPSCGGQMRFDRPELERFAVVCPTCNHLFDAGTAQFNKNLIPAVLLRKGAATKQVFAPLEPLNVEEFLPPPTAIPVRPINSASGGKRKASASSTRKSHASQTWLTRSAPLGVAVAALLLVGIVTSVVVFNSDLRASLGLGKYPEIGLVERYSTALDDCQQNLFRPRASTEDPENLLSENLQVLEQLLVDCVRMDPIPNSRHAELRSEMQKLFESQLKFKESTYSMVPTLKGEQRLKFAKLTALISLIELRLSYGLREVPVGSNEIEAYSRKGILLLRDLDRCLLSAQENGFDKNLKEISSVLDQMEALAIQRIGSGELRGEMPFEYRLMAKACEGWHQWCLESDFDVSSSIVSQAIETEYAHTWERYRLAMTTTNLPPQEFAAIERIQGRIQIASLDRTSKNLLAKGDSNSAPDRSVNSSSGSMLARQGSSENSSSENSSSENSPLKGSPLATTEATATPAASPGLVRVTPNHESKSSGIQTVGNVPEKTTVDSSIASGQATEGAVASRHESAPDRTTSSSNGTTGRRDSTTQTTPTGVLDFPRPRHIGPNSLCLKVQTSRPEYVKQQATTVGKLLRLQPDFQVNGGLMTISFGPYSGSLNDVVRKITFGTIEIIDGQSRTLFMVDQ